MIRIKLEGNSYERVIANLVTTTSHKEKLETSHKNSIELGLMSLEISCT